MIRIQNKYYRILIISLFFLIYGNLEALAAPTPMTIEISHSYYLNAGSAISRIAVADPSIADVAMASSTNLLVVAKKAGSTTLMVWTVNGMRQDFCINVNPGNSAIEAAIKGIMPDADIHVQQSGDNVLLRGTVRNQYEKNTAEKIAGLYGSKVVNLLETTNPYQVRIETQVIEISMDKERDLGFLFANPASVTAVSKPFNNVVSMGTTGSFSFGQTFARSYADLDATLQAMEQNGDAKVLSRPNITTLSGEKASILIGGKIPIPTSNSNGDISIDWRDYGIKLEIEPVVDSAENITTKVHAEVSTLDYTHELKDNGFTIPALTSREASTNVTLPSGDTMAIGGLLNSDESRTITKVPILGDIPIIGEFFKHSSKTRDKRELIILIKPTLVDQNTPVEMSKELHDFYKDGQKSEEQKVNVNQKEDTSTTPVKK